MNFIMNYPKTLLAILAVLVCGNGVLGYLFYDSYRTNIQNRELIAEAKIDNKDLSQDLNIISNKHEKLQKEVNDLKAKVKSVTYKKKNYKSKKLYSAGKSNKKHYKKYRVNYKKLYFQLKKKCAKQTYRKYRR